MKEQEIRSFSIVFQIKTDWVLTKGSTKVSHVEIL